jgi:hypothetical protein
MTDREQETQAPPVPSEDFRPYRRSQIAMLADWHPGFDMTGVSVSDADRAAGSPKHGDKIARNPVNHADRWLVAADYFAANFEPLPPGGNSDKQEEARASARAALDAARREEGE